MRRRFLLCGSGLILLVITMSVGAVSMGTQFPRHLSMLRYENSSGERGVSFFETDDTGSPTRAIWMLEDASRSSINRYATSDAGITVEAWREFSDGIRLHESVVVVEGRIIAEHFERSDEVKGVTRYVYDEKGRISRILCDRAKGWFTGEIVPAYGNDGLMVGAEILQNGERTGTIMCTNDGSGKLVKEHWDFGGRWTQTFEFEYGECARGEAAAPSLLNVYARPGWQRISRETYDFSGETGGPSTYAYDRGGRLVSKRFVRSDGLTTETDYLYDCRGVVKKSYRSRSDGSAAIFSYEFDNDGTLVSRRFVATDGRKGSESYERRADGVLQSARYDGMDGWLTGRLTFESDDDRRLVSGRFVGDDGDTADLSFGYDANDQLVRAHWEFANGPTQTYTFEYEPAPAEGTLAPEEPGPDRRD